MTLVTAKEVRRFLLDRFSATIAANGLNPSGLSDEFDLLTAGVVDSLGVLEMVSAVEQHFNITVDFEPLDPAELTVLGPFSRFVADNATKSAPAP